jgi:raffinose/stachyose/melibiose transport system substrate-binding protein
MMVSGSWWFGRIVAEMEADWGQFIFPGNDLHPGSSGNLWVVPANADSKSLATEFIDITLRPEVQEVFAQAGGLPVAADASSITDEKTRELTENFQAILEADGLAYYPDWPVPGYYDVVVSQLQSLVNQSKTPTEVLDGLQSAYEDGKADLLGS